jgi:hypothetical protein
LKKFFGDNSGRSEELWRLTSNVSLYSERLPVTPLIQAVSVFELEETARRGHAVGGLRFLRKQSACTQLKRPALLKTSIRMKRETILYQAHCRAAYAALRHWSEARDVSVGASSRRASGANTCSKYGLARSYSQRFILGMPFANINTWHAEYTP